MALLTHPGRSWTGLAGAGHDVPLGAAEGPRAGCDADRLAGVGDGAAGAAALPRGRRRRRRHRRPTLERRRRELQDGRALRCLRGGKDF